MTIAGSRPRFVLVWKTKPLGFSAIELMVSLTVAMILLGIGVPAFSALIANLRIAAAARDFLAAINLTRSEAIQRGARVDLVPVDGRNWKSGWIVFVDSNGNLQPDASEPVIFSHGPAPKGLGVESNFTDDTAKYLSYTATGRTRTHRSGQQPQSGTVTFSLDSQARKIKINFLGRARICNPVDDPSDC